MAAIAAPADELCSAGDHILVSRSVFAPPSPCSRSISSASASRSITSPWLIWASGRPPARPQRNCSSSSRPVQPLAELVDIAALAEWLMPAAQLVVDNCFCTPVLQQPLKLGADIVIHSATKFIDGQGRCLGGVVAGRGEQMKEVVGFLRTAGPDAQTRSMPGCSSRAWKPCVCACRPCATAQQLAEWLEQQPQVEKVYYAGLPSHPQHELAKRQQKGLARWSASRSRWQGRTWRFIDATRLFSITANLGDAKSTITHPGTTTHGRLGGRRIRAKAGIRDSLIRIAVGLEKA